MKSLFSIIFILILVVLAGLFIVPSFIDWSHYKDQIKTQVEKATGYNVDINGELRAAILPTPHVNLNNVTIDSGNSNSPVAFKAQVEKASISIALMPLLSGNIAVNDVTLINPIVDVAEKAPSQTPEQAQLEQLTSSQELASEESSIPNVQLDNVYLEGAKLSYKPLSGDTMMVELPSFRMSADSLKGPFEIDGRVIYNNFDLNIDGTIGEMVDDQPITIATKINGGAYALGYNGLVDISKPEPEIQGEVIVRADSIQSLASQFGAKDITIKDQSFVLSGLIAGNAKAIKLDNGQLKLGQAEAMPINFSYGIEQQSGRVKLQNIPGGGMIDLDIAMVDGVKATGQIAINNIKSVAVDTLGVVESATFDNPQIPNSVSGDIAFHSGDTLTLKSKTLNAGDYKIQGIDVAYTSGDTPKINAVIQNFEGARISATGTLDVAQGVNVAVAHPNAAAFIQVFQKDFKSSPNLAKPFAFKGVVKQDDNAISITNMDADIGDIGVQGTVDIRTNTSVPFIAANLNFDTLDTRALLTGEKSTTVQSGGNTVVKAKSSSTNSGSPWTRDAIDTSALRSINLDLTAKANTLVHGTWLISNPVIDIDLNDGVLDIRDISGGLFGGKVTMSGQVSAKQADQPLSIRTDINASDVNLTNLVKAALAQNKDRVIGTGGFNLSLNTTGLSSSALIFGLNGDGAIKTSDLKVNGIDLAKVTEAISDESFTDLAAVVQGAFRSGQTPFEPINHQITIREGTMPVNNFTLVSPTAKIISNGSVSFSNWMMNVTNTVDFTDPDDLPNVEMTIKGPLNAPQQSVANDILVSFIKNKYGAKIQNKVNELIGDKLGADSPAGAIINNLLGLPQPTQQPPANDNVEQPLQEQAPQQQEQPKLEEQLIRGLFDRLQ